MTEPLVVDPAAFKRLEKIDGPQFVEKMISLFRQNVEKQLIEAYAGLESDDPARIEKASHAIRSSAGNFGAAALHALATEIETSAAQWDTETRRDKISELEEYYQRVNHDLQAYLSENR